MTDAREERGLAIAAKCKLRKKGAIWLVPSQSADRRFYSVTPDKQQPHCSCPDHQERGCKCKHIFAVEIVIQRELFDDGSITETRKLTVTEAVTRPSYPQNWPAYNAAQTNEKDKFQILLRDLCQRLPQSPAAHTGRKPFPIQDAIFAACFKVYSTISARRFACDLRDAHAKGFIGRVPSVPMVFKIFESPHIFGILQSLVVQAATPLRALEANFACDSSGFASSRFDRWYDHKFGDHRIKRAWVKAHIMTGCKTNVVTAIEIHDQHAGDSPQLKPLLETTVKNFKPQDVCADMAYLSHSNIYAIARAGASPMIPFKSNSSPNGSRLWEHLYHYHQLHRQGFLDRYHQRSNVESTFSMVKAKFGDSVRSKTDVAMKNEVMAKFLCHNICCVIQSIYEYGIDPSFWTAA
ncbi:MAG TPA: transposase [Pirellulaceae bacterium]